MVKVVATDLPEVLLVEPEVFADARGWLMESWNAEAFRRLELRADFVQDNHSFSARGVLRGLHYQLKQPQGKLVRTVMGRIYDVAVDLRRSSPRFGRWIGVELSAQNKRMLWIPPGFAHGFLSLEEGSQCLYKCTNFHAPHDERGLLWSDPSIGIEWPIDEAGPLVLSSKDAVAPLLKDADTYA